MVERHAKRRARASIVPGHVEPLEAEMLHHLDLVLGHAAERVVAVIRPAAGLPAVAVAAQVGTDDREVLREPRRDQVPRHQRQWIPVQQEHRRPAATVSEVDRALGIAGLDLDVLEPFEHGSR